MRDTGPVVIFGGRSEIGVEVARLLAPDRTVVLAARRTDDLAGEVAAVRAAGAARVEVCEFDADDLSSHAPLVASIVAAHGPIDVAVVAFGILGDQARASSSAA
jgi:NAD(P)-dependent dehydrogenase (short-subunit alcohol dehydrogenase family)